MPLASHRILHKTMSNLAMYVLVHIASLSVLMSHVWRPSEPLDGRDALRDPTTLSNTTEDSEWDSGSMDALH